MLGRTGWKAALAVMIGVTSLAAQADTAEQSAIGTKWRDFGGFGGLTLRFGDMNGEFAAFPGAELAVLLKQRVYLGVAGAGLATDHDFTAPGANSKLEMGYGGLLLGFVITTRSLVHATVQSLIGAGGVRTRPAASEDWDGLFVFEPSAAVELKLAPVARIGFGLGYRFVGGSALTEAPDEELRGISGTFTVRLGWF